MLQAGLTFGLHALVMVRLARNGDWGPSLASWQQLAIIRRPQARSSTAHISQRARSEVLLCQWELI